MKNKLIIPFLITLFFVAACKKEKQDLENPNVVTNIIEQPEDSAIQIKEYIIINIDGIRNVRGLMNIALYNSEETFNDPDRAYREYFIDVSAKTMTVRIDDLSPGEYAFGLFHDENKNYQLDQNFIGMPTEGFAFSNNALGNFSAPSYNQARFRIPENNYVTQNVTLKFYP